jgi:hypothetical protein
MIIALLALAIAMILGGLLAAFFGWEIVLVERGWTMVIAGSVTAASGALLLGIAAVVSRLKRIENRLSRLQGGLAEGELSLTTPAAGALAGIGAAGGLVAGQAAADDERVDESQPVLPLFEAEDKREREDVTVSIAEWPEDREAAPVIPFPPRTTPISSSPPDEETDLKVPNFLLAGRAVDTEEESRVAEADIADDERERERGDREPKVFDLDRRDESLEAASVFEPEAEPEAGGEPAVAEDDEETPREDETPSEETSPATVVGTYNSGDNKYVMFSDGSIEAQTPSGVFRFKSLDELKEFIAAGGEGNSSASI